MQKVHIRLAFPLMRGADMLFDVVLQLLVRHAFFHSVQFELVLKIDVADGVQNFSDSGINAWRMQALLSNWALGHGVSSDILGSSCRDSVGCRGY
jgi:hypothetical protein